MAKSMWVGGTDYSNQTLDDIVTDLESDLERIKNTIQSTESDREKLMNNGYWRRNVSTDFKSIYEYSLRNFKSVETEFVEILQEIKIEVMEHHYNRLQRIGRVSDEINIKIGAVWNQDDSWKEYGNNDFQIVEEMYADTKDMAGNLLDVSNIAVRLKDYIGKKNIIMTKKNNPYLAGSFFLLALVVLVLLIATVANYVTWYALPIVVIGSVIALTIVGALQLKNDEMIEDETFLGLMKISFKKLPLINKLFNNKPIEPKGE